MATLLGSDVVNLFYDAINETQSNSHFTLAVVIRWLDEGIRLINREELFVEHNNISLTAGTRHYRLPDAFIREIAVLYKGLPLIKSEPHRFDWYSGSNGTPLRYFVTYPVSVSSELSAAVTPYLIIDPPPDTTTSGTEPIFPKSGDAWVTVWYSARHDDDFSTTNYTTKNFYMPYEYASGLAQYIAYELYSIDGNPLAQKYEKSWEKTLLALRKHRNNTSIHYPTQVRIVW